MHSSSNTSLYTDHSLLNRLHTWDDAQSWESFFKRYRSFMYGFARRQGLSNAEAEEVVQNTLLSVAKSVQSFRRRRERGSFRSWLCRVLLNRSYDVIRTRSRGLSLSEAFIADESDVSGPTEAHRPASGSSLEAQSEWDKQWAEQILQTLLEKLKSKVNPRSYQAFYLSYVKEQSVTQVAKKLGISSAQVYLARYRVKRVLNQMCTALNRDLL